ncbi:hypothetical protein C8R43DRAFT_973786 [Mycena crocata]|nr:hypothetical protein C8R43DRAFT_973786 [Mycena crocata]
MFSFSPRPVSRVLDIPELLDMIFGHLDNPSNASNASVCKRWSGIALDTLWREVDNLYRLFTILTPMQPLKDTPDSPYAFITPPNADDWRRFDKYARRVRLLSFHAECVQPRLCPTVFEDVARTRTSLNILPNVTTLSWHASLPLAVMFMHTSVKRFVLWLPGFTPPDTPLPFFRDLASRMPNLTCLDIRTNVPMHDMEAPMVFLLQSLLKLRKLVLPRYQVTTRITETLARLEDLGCVEFQYEHGCGDPGDTDVFKPKLDIGAFPSLWDLSLTITLGAAVDFMKHSFAPTNLTALFIDSRLVETPSAVNGLLTMLAETCQLLESLGIITLVGADGSQTTVAPSTDERLNFSTLCPLEKFPNLINFEIIHLYPLDLRFEDVERLARSWPSLRKLILNNEPFPPSAEDGPLSLKALLPFAQHCPELEQLGLFLHASAADVPRDSSQFKPFAKLQRLSMGVSTIGDDGDVALFLSRLCPLNTQIEFGVTWETDETLFEAMSERWRKWTKVAELLPLLTKMRMEERERTQLLVAEVQDLRMRSGVLMDQVGRRSGESCVML